MALFAKNPNEAAYHGGKKHWADVIKNSGSAELLIWRQPEEDFNTNSTLIVMPGEKAIFVNGGTIEEVFDNGTYKLSTQNYPFISRLRNAFTGGISTFNCVVYFVRKTDSKEIIWGTDTPIQVRDKVWGVRTEVRARGAYKIRIVEPDLFLETLIGNNVQFQTDSELVKYFRNELQGKIKSAVSKFLNSLSQELIGIDAYMDELSEKIEPFIDEMLADYGLECVRFTLSGLDVDISKYDQLDQSQMDMIAKTRGFQADKAGLDILGNDWGRVQGVHLMEKVADNPNAGGTATVAAGIGMSMGVAGAFGSVAQQTFNPAMNQMPTNTPPSPPSAQTPAAPAEDPMETLMKLKKLADAGLITQSEYDAKKAEILSRL